MESENSLIFPLKNAIPRKFSSNTKFQLSVFIKTLQFGSTVYTHFQNKTSVLHEVPISEKRNFARLETFSFAILYKRRDFMQNSFQSQRTPTHALLNRTIKIFEDYRLHKRSFCFCLQSPNIFRNSHQPTPPSIYFDLLDCLSTFP